FGKINRLRNVEINSLRNTQKLWKAFARLSNRFHQFGRQQNVRVDVAHQVGSRAGLRFSKNVAEKRRAIFVCCKVRLMRNAQFSGRSVRSFIISEQNNFWPWIEQRPTGDGIPLDYVNMTFERFWNRKNRHHSG